jgi:hypothetical protein
VAVVVVVELRVGHLRQLGERDALAQCAGRLERLVPLAAGGGGYGTRRCGRRAASPEKLGPQPRLDAAHACEHPAKAQCIQSPRGYKARQPKCRRNCLACEPKGRFGRRSYLVLYRRCNGYPTVARWAPVRES